MPETAKVLYYPVWLSNHAARGSSPWKWGKPCDSSAEAGQLCRAEWQRGSVSLTFVVRFAGGKKEVLSGYVRPESARKIIRHYEQLLALLADPE